MRKRITTLLSVSILLLSSQAFGWSVKGIKKNMHDNMKKCNDKVRYMSKTVSSRGCTPSKVKKDCLASLVKKCKLGYKRKIKKCRSLHCKKVFWQGRFRTCNNTFQKKLRGYRRCVRGAKQSYCGKTQRKVRMKCTRKVYRRCKSKTRCTCYYSKSERCVTVK